MAGSWRGAALVYFALYIQSSWNREILGQGIRQPNSLMNQGKLARQIAERLDSDLRPSMYQYTFIPMNEEQDRFVVERVQTGVRIEKRLLKVLKALAEYCDMTLGDLLEGIVLHALDGKCAFGPETLAQVAAMKKIYGLDLDATASHRLREKNGGTE